MKKLIYFFLILYTSISSSQNKFPTSDCLKITYSKKSNGKEIDNQNPIWIFANENETLITSKNIITKTATFPNEQTIIKRSNNTIIQFAELKKTNFTKTTDSISLANQKFELIDEIKDILGYKCKKAKTVINSNQIELWYTNDLKIKGAPTTLGQNLGLVLELNRNNTFTISAVKIEKLKKTTPDAISGIDISSVKKTDILTYRDLLWKSRFKTIPVFENETISFSDTNKSNDSILKFANGTVILKKVTLPAIKSSSKVFINLQEQSNGDAYDRTGTVFMIPTENEENTFIKGFKNGVKTLASYDNGNGKIYHGAVSKDNFRTPVELMRFFTPFGIKQYNHIELKDKTWHDKVNYRQDISDFNSILSNHEVWIGVFIGNYDKGGHKISLNMTVHDEEDTDKSNLNFVSPLFYTTNILEMAGQEYSSMFDNEKGLIIEFDITKEVKNAKLKYISTGHGGWENGDEFVPKLNSIFLDGKNIFSFTPWREDCGSYRLYNPASGNFNNGLSSSDYSRSNWCPGTITNPMTIDLGNLTIGKHILQIKIPQGKPEGSSFSYWNLSGVLLGEQ
ncbi:PNGase F N-terminal domain-containing protein [Flavobacterium sp. H122]|uniref:PNGase F N-terminal domain-containing protein n=1 Tax=Flavobacterium sp. H122 TaxID=2529860 RepID=UPI0010AAF0D3|nr:PNGase F N-terminal domain-containing protein [Flavobacterium sp. H122]